jgi:hypothetical protein
MRRTYELFELRVALYPTQNHRELLSLIRRACEAMKSVKKFLIPGGGQYKLRPSLILHL